MIYNVCEGVWAGDYPGSDSIAALTGHGVTTYVNLTRWDEKIVHGIRSYRRQLPKGSLHARFPLWTYWLPAPDRLMRIVDFIEGHNPAYLHCRHGIDRTGVVAALLLTSRRGLTLEDALKRLTEGRGQPSPRMDIHFRYLAEAQRSFGRPSIDRGHNEK